MAQPLRKPVPEPLSYSDRIRESVREGNFLRARALLAEALEQGDSGEDLSHWQRVLGPARVIRVGGERDMDRAADFQWIKEHSQEYVGQWIALFGGELLAHGDSLKEVLRQLELHPSGQKALLHHIHGNPQSLCSTVTRLPAVAQVIRIIHLSKLTPPPRYS